VGDHVTSEFQGGLEVRGGEGIVAADPGLISSCFSCDFDNRFDIDNLEGWVCGGFNPYYSSVFLDMRFYFFEISHIDEVNFDSVVFQGPVSEISVGSSVDIITT